jgi:RNA polymerase sigma-70 factor (ECF subfamily)
MTTADLEKGLRIACAAGEFEAAASRALEAYGEEILSFLMARLRDRTEGEEAFSMFAEDFWKGLPDFAFRCTVRAWMYTLARNAGIRHAASPHRRRERNVPLAGDDSLSALVDRIRTTTEMHLRTDFKDRARSLRERLDPEDQTLLILHVDRAIGFRELALVLHDGGEELEGTALDREAARLRKRFERLKAALREMATREGLIKS